MEIQPIISVAGHQQNFIEDVLNHFSNEAFFQCLPPGYRFQPTDEELIVQYLAKKVNEQPLPRNKIRDVELYDYNPETLSQMYKDSGEKDWYFFTPRNRKYKNGQRPNRAAGDGYWKATGADKNIDNSEGKRVGFRKALVFYVGKAPKGVKTAWIMHEYRVYNPPECDRSVNAMRLDNWVLCRIYKKTDRTINMKNPNMENTEEKNDNEEEEEEKNNNEEDVEIDIDPVDIYLENGNYNNFEMPYPMIDPPYQNNPYMWGDNNGLPPLPPHNIVGDINHHQQLQMHHPAGFGFPWQHAQNWQVMESHNMKLLDHGNKQHVLTHNNSSLHNSHFTTNFQHAANAGLEIHNPYLKNSQAPQPVIKGKDDSTPIKEKDNDSTPEDQPDQNDIDQYLAPTPME